MEVDIAQKGEGQVSGSNVGSGRWICEGGGVNIGLGGGLGFYWKNSKSSCNHYIYLNRMWDLNDIYITVTVQSNTLETTVPLNKH